MLQSVKKHVSFTHIGHPFCPLMLYLDKLLYAEKPLIVQNNMAHSLKLSHVYASSTSTHSYYNILKSSSMALNKYICRLLAILDPKSSLLTSYIYTPCTTKEINYKLWEEHAMKIRNQITKLVHSFGSNSKPKVPWLKGKIWKQLIKFLPLQ